MSAPTELASALICKDRRPDIFFATVRATEVYTGKMPLKNPPHPGHLIRTKIIQRSGLSVTVAALALNVSRSALSNLLNAKSRLTAQMAVRIHKAFGLEVNTLVAMQANYDVSMTQKFGKRIVVRRALPKRIYANPRLSVSDAPCS